VDFSLASQHVDWRATEQQEESVAGLVAGVASDRESVD
jgi:hypothetical protein